MSRNDPPFAAIFYGVLLFGIVIGYAMGLYVGSRFR